MELPARIADQLDMGQADAVAELTAEAIAEGLPAATILNEGLIAGMDVVGEKFRTHQIFLPHVLLAARAMHAGMDLLKPLLMKDRRKLFGHIYLYCYYQLFQNKLTLWNFESLRIN